MQQSRRRNPVRRGESRRRSQAAAAIVLVIGALAVVLVLRAGSGGTPSPSDPAAGAHATSTPGRTGDRPAAAHHRARGAGVPASSWRVAGGSPMAWAQPGVVADHATVRDLLTLALGGRAVRIRISNQFGNAPMLVGAATVARSTGAANVVASTVTPLTLPRRREHGDPGGARPAERSRTAARQGR